MKHLKRFNESIDEEDFQNIFQDLIDDFPEIKWNINQNKINSILKNEIPKGGVFPYGRTTTPEPNLIGFSQKLPIGHARGNFLYGYKKLKPYFLEIKDRLSEHGINIGFYKRVVPSKYGSIGSYYNEFFVFSIVYRPNKT